MAVYGYCRVSTDRQADDGESLGTQERQIRGHTMILGYDLADLFVERGVSGSKPLGERPEGARLLAALRPGDVVITAKLDRMFRSALDALNVLSRLKAQGIALHMIDLGGDVTNGHGKLMFTIIAAFAEAERDRIRERITDVKRDQRERGRFLGGTAPFGYRKVAAPDGRGFDLVEDADQQRALARIRDLHAEGKSLRTIADTIKGDGFSISHVGVKKILQRTASTAV